MKNREDIKVLQKTEYYSSTEYPELVTYADKQLHSMWLHTDTSVGNDLHSMLVDLSTEEREAVIYILKMFVHYELRLGANFWTALGTCMPRAEVQRMCTTFANMEISVHSPFYAEVNRLLNIDTPEFYLEYKGDPVLEQRMRFIEDNCNLSKSATVIDILVTLAVLSLLEGVVLYSSFALLKSFQANGNNSIPNIVTGVDYVVVDEQLHAEGAAALFNVLLEEAELTNYEKYRLTYKIHELTKVLVEKEYLIIEKVFNGKKLPSIKKEDLKIFVRSRANLVLNYLDVATLFLTEEDSIANWFYKNINSPTLTDFFNRTVTEYTRDWNEGRLKWITK